MYTTLQEHRFDTNVPFNGFTLSYKNFSQQYLVFSRRKSRRKKLVEVDENEWK